MIECFNKIVGNMLVILVEKDQKNWDEVLLLVMMVYCSVDQEMMFYFLNMMMLGCEVCLFVDFVYGSLFVNSVISVLQYVVDFKDCMCNVYEVVREYIKSVSNK